jgi:hypothetical protein
MAVKMLALGCNPSTTTLHRVHSYIYSILKGQMQPIKFAILPPFGLQRHNEIIYTITTTQSVV